MGTDGDVNHKWVEKINEKGEKVWEQVDTRFAGETPAKPPRKLRRLLFTGRKRQDAPGGDSGPS